jgi:hypothetical protein
VLLGFLVLLLALGGGHALLLHWMSGQMQVALDSWAAQRRAQGWQVSHGPPEGGGWPFAATLRLPETRLASGPFEWQARAVTLAMTPWNYDRLELAAAGPQQLAFGGPPMPLRTASLHAELLLDGTAPPRAGQIRAESLRLDTPTGPIDLPSASLTFQNSGPAQFDIQLRLHQLTLPMALPLGQRIEDVSLDVAIFGAVDSPGTPARRAAQWRDAGGRVDIKGMTLRWGSMAASASATLALDDALQPSGTGTIRVANATQTLETLVASGIVPARSAAMARTVLPLMMQPDPGGGSPVIELPVTLENRSLSAARLPLMRVRAVEW